MVELSSPGQKRANTKEFWERSLEGARDEREEKREKKLNGKKHYSSGREF